MSHFLSICVLALMVLNTPCFAYPRQFRSTNARATQERPMLVLYYSPNCPYSTKVLRYLSSIHKTVPMKNVLLDPSSKAELLKQGGKSQVPCLMINGQALYESDEIIRWLSTHKEFLSSNY
jgi:glutaredoxin 3